MPQLVIRCLWTESLNGLSRRVPLEQLTEKTVSMTVRRHLRQRFGDDVEVSCTVRFSPAEDAWIGRCWIKKTEYEYRVFGNTVSVGTAG
jgi:hypothetical protein